MSMLLQVYRAKPNPAGKDRTRSGPIPQQLVAEWVDIKNIGTQGVPFSSMEVHDTEFGPQCTVLRSEQYWKGRNTDHLEPGQILRVYTGDRAYESTLSAEDRGWDVAWRGFADRSNFVLNNDCGDVVKVFWLIGSQWYYDAAGYAPRPPEGAVLHRVGDRLQPVTVGVY